VAGFEDIGRVAALGFRGVIYQLRRVEERSGGSWFYSFAPWPENEMPRAKIHYPKDELERLDKERVAQRQEEYWLARRLLSPVVGGLPGTWQEWVSDQWELDFLGASKVNAYLSFAVAMALAVPIFVLSSFAAAFGLSAAPPLWVYGVTIYLIGDSMIRFPLYWNADLLSSFWDRRDSTELGYLALEALDQLLRGIGILPKKR
jgi:hypothetical protein